jgi:PST family polysaccharide transporter
MSKSTTYGQILRSSSIVGGAQAVTLLIGFVRTKVAAVFLGPTGVGLIGLYQNLIGMLSMLAGLGIATSGVRAVAEATASGDQAQVTRLVKVLNRLSWALGGIGWLITACLAYPLSLWLLGDPNYALGVALAGGAVMLTIITSGQATVLQGTRRLGDLARINVGAAAAGTIVSLGCYYAWGNSGIVPALVLSALVTLGWSWWFTRNIIVAGSESYNWVQSLQVAKPLLGLGLALTWSAGLTTGISFVIRGLITKQLGLEAAGIYQAAWSISGLFAGFILGAMGTDFYPRLTAIANDHAAMNKLVNEQTEVGVLLAIPGLLGTLVFAPQLLTILYTPQFGSAAELMPGFIVGVFGRVISWPLGFILLAKGESKWFTLSETTMNLAHIIMVFVLLYLYKLPGIGYAFALLNGLNMVSMLIVTGKVSGFQFTVKTLWVIGMSSGLVALALITRNVPESGLRLSCAVIVLFAGSLFSLFGLTACLPSDHRVRRLLSCLTFNKI